MAAGASPKFTINYPLGGLTHEQFHVLAMHTARELKWPIVYVSPTGMVIYTDRTALFPNSELRIKIEGGTANISSLSTGTALVDLGRNKKYVKRFTDKLEAIRPLHDPEMLSLQYEDIRYPLEMQGADLMYYLPESVHDQTPGALSFFTPRPGYFITPILIYLNILVFILMAFAGVSVTDPDSQSLIRWGANFKPLTLGAEPWRLLTSCFVHAGFLHLAMNMGALLFIGMVLEPIMGKARLLSAYLLTGLAASLTSLWWHSISVSVGASGAIFGLYGVFIALLTTNLLERNLRRFLLLSIFTFVGYNLANGMKDGIDNAAHIGGLLSGLLVGYAFVPSLRRPASGGLKWATIALLTLFTITTSVAMYRTLPDTAGQYETSMRTIAAREQKALEALALPPGTPRDTMLIRFGRDGIANWEANIRTLDSLTPLRLPNSVIDRNEQMRNYYTLRIKSYTLYIKALKENTNRYQSEIIDYDRQMEAVMQTNGQK